jgi:two-component system cell cycle sensor histidine kinase/response regulator CckA
VRPLLRILSLADQSADVERFEAALRSEGLACEIRRVATEADYVAALDRADFDLILADYSLPGFDGLSALKAARARSRDVPFLFVSGAPGEELAIESLKAGATDYVLKERLSRLGPCVRRAMQERDERAALREREAQLRFALESAHMGTWSVDLAAQRVDWSTGCANLFGLPGGSGPSTREEFLRLVHPDDRETLLRAADRTLQEGADYAVEYRVLFPDRTIHWHAALGRAVRDAEGAPVRVHGVVMDITARREAEERIRRLAAFPQLNPNPVLEFSADGALTYYNDAAVSAARKVGGEHPSDILPATLPDLVRECLASGKPRLRLELPYGKRTLSWSFFPMTALQVVHCYVGDITERVLLEEQFRQAQKMESVGQLAGGVAHDFNNLLQVIQGYTLLARDDTLLPAERLANLDEVLAAAERAAQLTRQLLAFGRRQPLQKVDTNLNELVSQWLKMIRRLIGEQIEIVFTPEPEVRNVRCDRAQIEQVLLNLCVNSRDAMPQGGRITLQSTNVLIDTTYRREHPWTTPGHYVALQVSDTGCGMDRDTLERIYEPFFTTKPKDQGTGLGLAVVYGIVKQHDGLIEVWSEPGKGTTFRVCLPAVAPGTRTATSQRKRTSPRGSETILVAEDEASVRQLAVRVLESAGYRVLAAADGEEAIRLFAEHAATVDLVLLDVVMPKLGGQEAYERMARLKPGLPVLFCSGYSGPPPENGQALIRPGNFLYKPYAAEDLLRLIRERLLETEQITRGGGPAPKP